ncbi:DUF389 domain-containing protein [Actinomadura hibisca]|uniref:DUF389 domain-containing protein n=1 Tax=Actinomadura hibisca TaxID=68565 RepID=UPI000A00F006|nr:DUF389 domain-containing protein [Actinomadura hibisca]
MIAAAGVLADSTATIIITPLSTPIMGMALGVVKRSRTGAGRFVLDGVAAVVAVGLLTSLALPGSYRLLANGQISGRTSPGLADLVAAVATGLAGALARRDVAAVLPGVAISISLVPPLVVSGVCLGAGAPALAFGALVLFLSNMLSLVLVGTFVFAALGYVDVPAGASRRRAVFAFGGLGVLVVPRCFSAPPPTTRSPCGRAGSGTPRPGGWRTSLGPRSSASAGSRRRSTPRSAPPRRTATDRAVARRSARRRPRQGPDRPGSHPGTVIDLGSVGPGA